MSEVVIRHKDRILEAIDQLRKRKARPDVNRICAFMFRRFSVNCIETKLDLQKLIDAEIVIKVDYKGSTSYRNASKWAMLTSYKYRKEIDTSSIISSAVAELIVLEPDYLDIGVPENELETHMLEKDGKRFSRKNLQSVLKREVEIGTLVKLQNGNYFLGEHSPLNNSNSTMVRPSASRVVGSPARNSIKHKLASKQTVRRKRAFLKSFNLTDQVESNSDDSDKMKPDDQSSTSEGANVGFRVGGRQKRAKKVFDPSDNNLPTRPKKRGPGRPLGSLNKSTIANNASPVTPLAVTSSPQIAKVLNPVSPQRVTIGTQVKPFTKVCDNVTTPSPNPSLCYICHSYGTRVKGVPERLISCSECATRAHPSCVENNNDGVGPNGWQCGKCKFCIVCELKVKDPVARAVCAVCRDCYHIQCHTPSVPERVRAKQIPWTCCKCADIPVDNTAKENPVKETPVVINEVVEPLSPVNREREREREFVVETLPPPAKVADPKPKDVPANCLQDPFDDIPIDESIPDAKHWTTNQVYQYFCTQLKPELAQVFKDQDIDGQSLLLMKRMDVLTSLSLKLGPALKVYGHVRKLQTRKSHPRILWS